MKMLHDICDMKMERLQEAMKESYIYEEKVLKEKGRAFPNECGNRKQRRAAQAVARKKELA